MPKFFTHTIVFLILLCSLPIIADEVDPREAVLSQAILALMDGDAKREAGQPDAAAPLYRDALNLLKDLQGEHGDFKARIVAFRIDYLEEQLHALSPATSDPAAASARLRENEERDADRAAPPAEDYERLYIQAKEEGLRNSIRLLDMEKRHLDLQMSLRERDTQLREVRDELATLRRDAERSRSESAREIREATSEAQSQRRFNALLEDRVNNLEKDLEEMSEVLATSREKEAEAELELQRARSEVGQARRALEELEESARQETEQLGDRLLQRSEELRTARTVKEALREQIAPLEEQVAGLPLLEETVIELHRRLNAMERELEQSREALATVTAERDQLRADAATHTQHAADRHTLENTVASLEAAREDQLRLVAEQLNRIRELTRENDALRKTQGEAQEPAEADDPSGTEG